MRSPNDKIKLDKRKIWGKNISGKGNNYCKGFGAETNFVFRNPSKGRVTGSLSVRGRVADDWSKTDRGLITLGLTGYGKEYEFYSKRDEMSLEDLGRI